MLKNFLVLPVEESSTQFGGFLVLGFFAIFCSPCLQTIFAENIFHARQNARQQLYDHTDPYFFIAVQKTFYASKFERSLKSQEGTFPGQNGHPNEDQQIKNDGYIEKYFFYITIIFFARPITLIMPPFNWNLEYRHYKDRIKFNM